MSAPRSVRFDDAVLSRLEQHVRGTGAGSLSAVVNRLTDEALRVEDHPGIMFRPGPSGRRAGLVNGPDVDEVVGAYRDVLHADASLSGEALMSELRAVTGLTAEQLSTVLRYYGQYAAEVDARIDANREHSERLERIWRAEQDLVRRSA